jgi:biopolymer transport protein ExbD
MAVIIDGGGGDRQKPLHAELNLVPYIDLLTCMVAFLLITAVWTQLARLEVQQRGQGDADAHAGVVDEIRIAVAVHGDGFTSTLWARITRTEALNNLDLPF